ncbi:hypothetical protein [Haloplanus natans]|uniref:hypothetical protein n=1 Tax=Haloplanus natans TaxID=376171 RepID=UPI0012FABB81|nr:hypothetical protein [Haloplanus natans]
MTKEQKERWEQGAEDAGVSLSGFIKNMTEAGMKKFDRQINSDESNEELRKQRDETRRELIQARRRIQSLENRLEEVTSDSSE